MSKIQSVTKNQLKANIIPLKIIMNTNIPDKHIIDFNSSLLYHPDLKSTSNLNKYPFFTNLYRYNEGVILNKSYTKIVNFFFNKNTFIDKLNEEGSKYGTPLNNIDDADENNLHNIMVMLKALFHINENIIEQEMNNSYENKYGSIENNDEMGETAKYIFNNVFNMNNISKITNMDIKDNYTYINLNGEKYTFQRLVWLNDVKNNPFYRELLKEYIKFNRWLNSKKGSKYKDILNKNSFENIESISNEYNTLRKTVAYWKESKKEKNNGNVNNLMIKLYTEKEFKKFFKTLTKYQNKESKNEALQKAIENSLSGYSRDKPEVNILDILRKLMNNDTSKNIKNEYYYIDILHDTKNDNYEINILVDFIKGEMNDEKYKKIRCNYESNKLGNFLEEKVFSKKKKFENRNKNTIYSIDENKSIDVKYNENENEDDIDDNSDENKTYEELVADKLGEFIDSNGIREKLNEKYKDDNLKILQNIKNDVIELYNLIILWYEKSYKKDNKDKNKEIVELIRQLDNEIIKIMSSKNAIFYSELFNKLKESENKKSEKKGGKKYTNKKKNSNRRKWKKTKKNI